ncbi:apelin [Rissa tridactyla]|uniref:apelin n=1 Tax=Rissa tridactyla TaxID=75485 RepID=UPI0023BAE098|nr:apelin [Rissa tridactyla]
MAAPRWLLLALLLLLLWLALVAAGPLGQAPDRKDAEDGLIRTLVRPRGARRGAGHRPGGARKVPATPAPGSPTRAPCPSEAGLPPALQGRGSHRPLCVLACSARLPAPSAGCHL